MGESSTRHQSLLELNTPDSWCFPPKPLFLAHSPRSTGQRWKTTFSKKRREKSSNHFRFFSIFISLQSLLNSFNENCILNGVLHFPVFCTFKCKLFSLFGSEAGANGAGRQHTMGLSETGISTTQRKCMHDGNIVLSLVDKSSALRKWGKGRGGLKQSRMSATQSALISITLWNDMVLVFLRWVECFNDGQLYSTRHRLEGYAIFYAFPKNFMQRHKSPSEYVDQSYCKCNLWDAEMMIKQNTSGVQWLSRWGGEGEPCRRRSGHLERRFDGFNSQSHSS